MKKLYFLALCCFCQGFGEKHLFEDNGSSNPHLLLFAILMQAEKNLANFKYGKVPDYLNDPSVTCDNISYFDHLLGRTEKGKKAFRLLNPKKSS
ncbi:MAG: hypothetical protein H3C41_07285 [Bacteroidales bacterium]|nr:hypothetical protein [Bacteroidales bacterium]